MTSISAERTGLAKVGMTMRRREQWGARRSYTDARSVTEPATKQFVHITVTNPGNYSSFDAHARAIEAIGISRFPSTGISYNRLFMAGTRTIYEAQPVGRRGAHTVNDFRRSSCTLSGCPSRGTSLTAPSWNLNYNARAYAICQNVGHSVPDHMVDDLARAMAADRLAGFVTRSASIHGHRCASSKSCPGDRMWARMGELKKKVDRYVANGLGSGTTPTPPEDDVRPSDWNAADIEKVQDLINNTVIKHTDKNLAWWLRNRANVRGGLNSALAEAADRSTKYGRSLGDNLWALVKHPINAEVVKNRERLDALLAAQEGLDDAAILARIDQHATEAAAERDSIAAALTAQSAVLEQVATATQGSDPAEAKLAAIAEILGVDEADTDA